MIQNGVAFPIYPVHWHMSKHFLKKKKKKKKENRERKRESEKRERKLADSTKASTTPPSLSFSSFFSSSSFCLRTLTETAHAEALNEKNARPEIA